MAECWHAPGHGHPWCGCPLSRRNLRRAPCPAPVARLGPPAGHEINLRSKYLTSNLIAVILGMCHPRRPKRDPGGLADPAAGPVPARAPRQARKTPRHWDWPRDAASLPEDAPLQALMLSATKLMGAYGQDSVRAAGLKLSLAGLGVLRILMGEDGLKASEVADRAWSSPGTLTSVVNTLVRDGFVERRPDEADRRVVRLYITDAGRAVITYYVSQAAARGGKHSTSSTATTRLSSGGSSSR